MLATQNLQSTQEQYKLLLNEKHMEIEQLRENLNRAIMDKQDFEIICQNQSNEINKLKNTEADMGTELDRN